jgi:hypothetical protein
MRWQLIAVLMIAGSVARGAVAADTPALSGYGSYVNSIRSIEFHSKFKDRNADSLVFTNSLSQDWKIDFVGKRKWCVTDKPTSPNSLTSRFFGSKTYAEQLIVPDQSIELSVNARNDQAEWCMADLMTPGNHWESSQAQLLYLSYPFGYIKTGSNSHQKILDVLRSDDVKSMTAENAGSLVVLKCTTSVYEIVLTLDPEKGWMPTKIDVSRVAPTTGPYQLTLAKYVVQESSQHDGVWLPDTFDCREETSGGVRVAKPGFHISKNIFGMDVVWMDEQDRINKVPGDTIQVPACKSYAEVALTNIKFNKVTDDDFRLRAKTPDGLKVSFDEPVPGEYEWQNGKIVPKKPASH